MLALYCRKSKKVAEGTDVSIPTQVQEGKVFAIENNFEYRFYVDEGISGAKDEVEDRPEFAQMLLDIKNGEITKVWCIDQSRIERHPLIWQIFQLEIIKNKAEYYPEGKLTDLEDPTIQMMTAVMSAANKMFTQLTSKKVKLAIQRNALEGKSHGVCAYGYYRDKDKNFLIQSDEEKIVIEIFKLSLSGMGAYTIANKLNKDGIPTKYNSFKGDIKRKDPFTKNITRFKKEDIKWNGNVISDMLTNTIYKGKKKLNDGFIDVKKIIDEHTWQKVQDNLKVNRKNVGPKTQYNYLLNGIIRCGNCGGERVGVKKKALRTDSNGIKKVERGSFTYKCKSSRNNSSCKDNRGINIARIENFIIHHLFKSKELKDMLLNAPKNTSEAIQLNNQLNAQQTLLIKLNKSIKRVLSILDDPELTEDENFLTKYKSYKKQKTTIEQELVEIKKRLRIVEDSDRNDTTKSIIESYTDDIEFKEIKKIVHNLIESVDVLYEKNGKSGYFLVQVKYVNYEEETLWTTNRDVLKWIMMSHYRNRAVNKEQLEEDRKCDLALLAFDGNNSSNDELVASGLGQEAIDKSNPNSEKYIGSEVISGRVDIIKLNKEELIYFE